MEDRPAAPSRPSGIPRMSRLPVPKTGELECRPRARNPSSADSTGALAGTSEHRKLLDHYSETERPCCRTPADVEAPDLEAEPPHISIQFSVESAAAGEEARRSCEAPEREGRSRARPHPAPGADYGP
ncbi:unnamed protein product [Parascedosporium putredinis]|uniref:Uncharacterized protein n=1 Tax=Parascedosporium putredinis TaxID=1442378 RepID=A0A9P1H0G4_9PEZI|nr:unnamed protein product [Parascedosporium putredinis]CAI7992641.1 unnamed protein product [Parascedosporium putredinis]